MEIFTKTIPKMDKVIGYPFVSNKRDGSGEFPDGGSQDPLSQQGIQEGAFPSLLFTADDDPQILPGQAAPYVRHRLGNLIGDCVSEKRAMHENGLQIVKDVLQKSIQFVRD